MGKQNQGKKGKRQRTHRTSSGLNLRRKATQELLRLTMKCTRWENNQIDPKKERPKPQYKGQKRCISSRHRNWDTRGMMRRMDQLRTLIKRPPLRTVKTSKNPFG